MTPPDTAVQKPAGSLADRAYDEIRDDILDGVFQPEQPLRLEALKERYGYSFSPIREALTRLASDRLAAQTSLRGFRVAPISLDEMWDILRARILVESEAFRLSILHGDELWEARVVAAFHAFSRCAARASQPDADRRTLEQRHAAFHRALLAGSGSPSLLHLAEQLYVQSERYRRPHLMAEGTGRRASRDVAAEHAILKDAALARDADAGTALLAAHYTNTGTFIEEALGTRLSVVASDA
ncbi:GntR family transcriptional regulator [Amorphus sp. MBR-141]